MVSARTSVGRLATRRYLRLVIAVGVLVACLAASWSIFAPSHSSAQDRVASAALDYGQRWFMWTSGPTVQSVQIVPLDRLEPTLASAVPPPMQQHVNLPDLLHRYGPQRQVGVVVLHGLYNSLPPDEGVTITQLLLLVDARSDRILLTTD